MPTSTFSNRCSDDTCPLCSEAVEQSFTIRQPEPATNVIDFSNVARTGRNTATRSDIDDAIESSYYSREEGLIMARQNCACETCKFLRAEDSLIRRSVVNNYSYSPGVWTPKSARNDPFHYHMGVELETDQTGYNIGNSEAASMKRPARFWIAKSDSSVSGPEFVSYPATLTYWRNNIEEISEMFKMLVHAGYRSHDGGAAGMHINVSQNAFDDAGHFARFLHLIYRSHRWSLLMSQRSGSQVRRWASLDACVNTQSISSLAEGIYNRASFYTNKYSAVNVPAGQGRIEFRLPRGTLRVDRFFKNLEWTVGMTEYTRQYDAMSDAIPEQFMSWVSENNVRYPYLDSFIGERAERLSDAAANVDLAYT